MGYLKNHDLLDTEPHLLPFALVKTLYFQIFQYLNSVNVSDDAKLSLQVGVALGIGVIGFLIIFPGEPFDYTLLDGGVKKEGEEDCGKEGTGNSVNGNKKEKKMGKKDAGKAPPAAEKPEAPTASDKIQQEPALDLSWSTEKIMKKTSKIQKLFMLSNEQMSEAIENAKLENTGVNPNKVTGGGGAGSGDEVSLGAKVDMFVYTTLIVLFAYFAYRDFGEGRMTRLIMQYFPREGAALGLFGGEGQETIYRLKGGGGA